MYGILFLQTNLYQIKQVKSNTNCTLKLYHPIVPKYQQWLKSAVTSNVKSNVNFVILYQQKNLKNKYLRPYSTRLKLSEWEGDPKSTVIITSNCSESQGSISEHKIPPMKILSLDLTAIHKANLTFCTCAFRTKHCCLYARVNDN